MDAVVRGARYTFVWSTFLTDPDAVKATAAAVRQLVADASSPDRGSALVIVGGGGWDVSGRSLKNLAPAGWWRGAVSAQAVADGMRLLLTSLKAAIGASIDEASTVLGLAACSADLSEHGGLIQEVQGLQRRVASKVGFHYLERAKSMGELFWPNNPCHATHPFGVMSDLHVQAFLLGLRRQRQGGKKS